MVFKLARKTLFEKKVFFLLVLAVHNQNLSRKQFHFVYHF